MYHENLLFLLSILEKDETIASYDDGSQEYDESGELPNMENNEQEQLTKSRETFLKSTHNLKGSNAKRRKCEDVDRALIEALEKSNTPSHPPLDEDEAFFASLLPSVRRFNEEEKLQFRLEIIQVIQKIKKQSRIPLPASSYSYPPQQPYSSFPPFPSPHNV